MHHFRFRRPALGQHRRYNNPKLLLVVGGLVVVALVASVITFAANSTSANLPSGSADLILAHYQSDASRLTKDANGTVQRNYQDILFELHGDGTLVCGNTASPNDFGRRKLSSGQLRDIADQISQTSAAQLPPRVGIEQDQQTFLDNFDSVIINTNRHAGAKQIQRYNGDATPQLVELYNIMNRLCQAPNQPINRRQVPAAKAPKLQGRDNGSLRQLIAKVHDTLVPTAQAAYWNANDESIQLSGINKLRAGRGLAPLQQSACLTQAARDWSAHMASIANRQGLSHSNYSGVVNTCGDQWQGLAENVAYQINCPYTDTDSCSYNLLMSFINSPPHQANMAGGYNLVGIGAYRDNIGSLWVTQEFAQCSGCLAPWTSPPTTATKVRPGIRIATTYGNRPYILDYYGNVVAQVSAPAAYNTPLWTSNLARDFIMNPSGAGGLVLDAYGGLHPFGLTGIGAPSVPKVSAYWRGWDIARDVVALSWTDNSGYVLDGFGGLNPYGNAPAAHPSAYWRGWDIARRSVMNSTGTGGYVLDGFGGLHSFAVGTNPQPGTPRGSAYWSNLDIARSVVLNPTGSGGYVLDGFGGIHPFAVGSKPMPPAPTGAEYLGFDGMRDMVVTNWATVSGYTVDIAGAVHPFGSAPAL